jgi:branched-subunit amino acid transport protein AzlD
MRVSIPAALAYTFALGAVVFFCRVFPFLVFRKKDETAETGGDRESSPKKIKLGNFLALVERIVPPVAMTVLAFNAMAGPVKADIREALPVLAGTGLTTVLHLWKRNALLSIAAGTALYMFLERLWIPG